MYLSDVDIKKAVKEGDIVLGNWILEDIQAQKVVLRSSLVNSQNQFLRQELLINKPTKISSKIGIIRPVPHKHCFSAWGKPSYLQ